MPANKDRYSQLIEAIFLEGYAEKKDAFEFHRDDIERHARVLGIDLPKNLGDLIYTFRYRRPLPESVLQTCPSGKEWLIMPAGRSRYRFVLTEVIELVPNKTLRRIKIPDATPGIIAAYALGDEQALLAKLRYNRLLDIFTRVTCYSMQNHLRTTVPEMGQVETDEIYIGVDRSGTQYVFPVQAKGGKDVLRVVQVRQDIAMCLDKFPALVCRPIATQFMADDAIAIFELVMTDEGIRVAAEKHYRLVSPDQITKQDLLSYKQLRDEL